MPVLCYARNTIENQNAPLPDVFRIRNTVTRRQIAMPLIRTNPNHKKQKK